MDANELYRLRRVLGAAEALLGARAIDELSPEDWALLERAVAEATRQTNDSVSNAPRHQGNDAGAA